MNPTHLRRHPMDVTARANRPAVIAHRGLSHRWPENTLCAFRAAVEVGVDAVELDFRTTADGMLVCAHDACLHHRLAPGCDAILGDCGVEQLNWPLLKSIDVGQWKALHHAGMVMPTLTEALAATRGATAVIERKSGSVAQTLAAVAEADAFDRVIINAFDWDYLSELHQAEPRLALSLCGEGRMTAHQRAVIASLPGSIVHWRYSDIDAGEVRALHEAGHAVWVWTVNADAALHATFELMVDGITTDRGDRLLKLMNRGQGINAARAIMA